jgi:ribosomal-protein-alanine N-acetyltransferase
VQIRRATAVDIPALLSLEQLALTAAHWPEAQYEAALSAETPARTVLIAEDESGMVGFIVGKAAGGELEIENLAVAGSAQRKGVGISLVKELLNRARREGIQTVFLEVRESNVAARSLYEKQSFVDSGRRRRYYRDPEEDAIIYRLAVATLHQH